MLASLPLFSRVLRALSAAAMGLMLLGCGTAPISQVSHASFVGDDELHLILSTGTVNYFENLEDAHQYRLRFRIDNEQQLLRFVDMDEMPVPRKQELPGEFVMTPSGSRIISFLTDPHKGGAVFGHEEKEPAPPDWEDVMTLIGSKHPSEPLTILRQWRTPPRVLLSPSGRKMMVASKPPKAIDLETLQEIPVEGLDRLIDMLPQGWGGVVGGLTEDFDYGFRTVLYDREKQQFHQWPAHVPANAQVQKPDDRWLFYFGLDGKTVIADEEKIIAELVKPPYASFQTVYPQWIAERGAILFFDHAPFHQTMKTPVVIWNYGNDDNVLKYYEIDLRNMFELTGDRIALKVPQNTK